MRLFIALTISRAAAFQKDLAVSCADTDWVRKDPKCSSTASSVSLWCPRANGFPLLQPVKDTAITARPTCWTFLIVSGCKKMWIWVATASRIVGQQSAETNPSKGSRSLNSAPCRQLPSSCATGGPGLHQVRNQQFHCIPLLSCMSKTDRKKNNCKILQTSFPSNPRNQQNVWVPSSPTNFPRNGVQCHAQVLEAKAT